MRRLTMIALVAAAGISFAALAADPVKIGIIMPLSGREGHEHHVVLVLSKT